ncbi:hypothetical protein AVEN_132667-1 [Araneus ventricosus]|uniref:Mos1 transposase HTH domain-containing protein n=1 Tax=Araneus ventricosus TaxID=182803 RepID=A0A4Y2AX78_ARAVE|nr:hypothetical protein AVEN_132667-1 [Araneus ventricosus]
MDRNVVGIEVRNMIRVFRPRKTSPAEIRRQLVEVQGVSVISRKHVQFLYMQFNRDRTDVRDGQISGRPSTFTTYGSYWNILPTAKTSSQRIFTSSKEAVGRLTFQNRSSSSHLEMSPRP